MRINLDVKALEWYVGTFLCQDTVAIDELVKQEDMHTRNQEAFNLPSRLIAKLFLFRLIFGGSAYAYASDAEFSHVSSNPKYWQKVIDAFYDKYKGWGKWHTKLMQDVSRSKQLVMPTGRIYTFKQYPNYRNEMEWPRTQILNYPVQGTSADIMAVYRVRLFRLLSEKYTRKELLFIATVHDSIEIDCIDGIEQDVMNICHQVALEMPTLIKAVFGFDYNLPFVVETEIVEDAPQ